MSRRTAILIALLYAMVLTSACWGVEPTTTLDNKEPGKTETAIGCLVADAFRDALHTDVALVSAGDLKAGNAQIVGGKLQGADLIAFLAYPDDALVSLALDGRKIREALETSVSNVPRPGLSFLQVSGLSLTYDSTKPVGSRITSLSIGGSPAVDSQAYTVAMPDSLAGGALGYWKLWSKKNITSKPDGVTCASAVEKFVKLHTKFDSTSMGRITEAK